MYPKSYFHCPLYNVTHEGILLPVLVLTFFEIIPNFKILGRKAYESIVAKREQAGDQYFLLFDSVFYSLKDKFFTKRQNFRSVQIGSICRRQLKCIVKIEICSRKGRKHCKKLSFSYNVF